MSKRLQAAKRQASGLGRSLADDFVLARASASPPLARMRRSSAVLALCLLVAIVPAVLAAGLSIDVNQQYGALPVGSRARC